MRALQCHIPNNSTLKSNKFIWKYHVPKVIVLFAKCCILTLEIFCLKPPSSGNDGRHIDGALCYSYTCTHWHDSRVTVSAIKHIHLAALRTELNQYVFNI